MRIKYQILIIITILVLSSNSISAQSRLGGYYVTLQALETALQEERYSDLEKDLSIARSSKPFEVPTYELLLFDAALMFRSQRYTDATRILGKLEVMLMIDSGWLSCDVESFSEFIDAKTAKDVSNAMCVEAYLAYYEQPTEKTLARVTKYWGLSRLLLRRFSQED